MKRKIAGTVLIIFLALLLGTGGCEKEKIVESTEYIHDVEYVQLPPDTVFQVDTVVSNDSVTVYIVDTVTISDTVIQVEYIYDTVVTVQNHYDTTIIVDTVLTIQCNPNEYLAVAALHYYSDPLVLEFIYEQFGYTDGWIFYLSSFQLGLTKQSSDVYDIYGYIDYWAPDWSGYYPLEFYWRVIYTGGDPADVRNWDITEPPTAAGKHIPGIRLVPDESETQQSLR
ncbi:MAG: hypothetical protein DRP46_10285 [Candidatus Zixiibacteriota bacterium]|nr:MAG: hypothetical protein DRP46_10285 [candidate division Zixibacteria bacterium]